MPPATVIDLDVSRPEPTGEPRGKSLRLAASFLAGVLLGGAGVSALWLARDARTEAASGENSLVAIPSSVDGAAPDARGIIRMDGRLAVINAGSTPVTVRTATGQGPGLLVISNGQQQALRPGDTGLIGVTLRVDCAAEPQDATLSLEITVDAGGFRRADYPVAYAGSAWHRGAQRYCEHLAGKLDPRW